MHPKELAATQEAYQNRPYAVFLTTRYFSGVFKFYTLDGALEYLFTAAERRRVDDPFDDYRSGVRYPDGTFIQARYFFL